MTLHVWCHRYLDTSKFNKLYTLDRCSVWVSIISQERCENLLSVGTKVHRKVDCKVKFMCQDEISGDV